MAGTHIPGEDTWTDRPGPVGETIADTVSDMADAAQDRVGRIADRVADGARRAANELRSGRLKQVASDVGSYAKGNPAQALVIAALVGFIVGRFLPRD